MRQLGCRPAAGTGSERGNRGVRSGVRSGKKTRVGRGVMEPCLGQLLDGMGDSRSPASKVKTRQAKVGWD